MPEARSDSCWYVLYTRPRHELSAALLLSSRFEQYLPLYSERSGRRDRAQILRKPLFPRYIFCNFNYDVPWQRNAVLGTPGVLDILRIRECGYLEPIALPESEIERIRKLEALNATPVPSLKGMKPGDMVEKRLGNGYVPVKLIRIEDEWRAIVEIEMLGRYLSVPVDVEELRKAA